MSKKYWFIVIFSILILAILYWYFNYKVSESIPTINIEETSKAEEIKNQNIRSIELEKPPFLK